VAAVGPEDAGGNGIEGGQHAGGGDVELVGSDQVARQPEGERDEGAEDKEIVEREAPDLQIAQRLELHPGTGRPDAGGTARLELGVVLGGEPEHHRHDHQRHRPDLGHHGPAEGDQHEGGAELGDRGADVADAEDAERRALLFLGVPSGNVGDADREGTTGQTDAEGGQQHHLVSGGVGQQEGGDGRQHHGEEVDDPPAVLIGPDPQEDSAQRTGQDGGAGQQAELGVGKTEILFDLHADDGKDRPDREADRKGQGAHTEHLVLLTSRHTLQILHGSLLNWPAAAGRGTPAPHARDHCHGSARFV
jgi:hypothetical protein